MNLLLEENVTIARYNEFFYLIIPDNFNENLQLEHTGFNVVYEDKNSDKSEESSPTYLINLKKINIEMSFQL